MAQRPDRLERLITREIGSCCEEDVDERLTALDSFADRVPSTADEDIRALKSLGNGTRYTIVRLLLAADRDLCVCELTPVIDVSDSAISHALSDLHDAGLVTRRKDGTWRYYGPTDRAERLVAALDATAEDR